MNQIAKWDPFQHIEHLHRRLVGSLLDDGSNVNRSHAKTAVGTPDWAPVVDITEDEQAYILNAELAGVKKDDVHVTLENGTLTLSGERQFEREEKNRKVHRIERFYGSFSRSFDLPEDVNADKVNAAFNDGVLTVTVAKSEQAKPKRIQVNVT